MERETVQHNHVPPGLTETERSWDEWMEEVCATLEALPQPIEPKPAPTFEAQLRSCLQHD